MRNLLPQFEAKHWDNCKVKWDQQAVSGYILKALLHGHEVQRILNCYQKALEHCHSIATDHTVATGKITEVSSSGVIQQARRFLATDGLTRRQRILNQLRRNLRLPDGITPKEAESIARHGLDPVELAEVRCKIEATWPK